MELREPVAKGAVSGCPHTVIAMLSDVMPAALALRRDGFFLFLLHRHRRCFWIVRLVLPCRESFVGELGRWDWVEPLLITLPLDNRHPAYTFRH